jgi:iron complex outermembrane receptor protein
MRDFWKAVADLRWDRALTSLARAGTVALAPAVFAQAQTSAEPARVEVSAAGLSARAIALTGFAELPEQLPFSISTTHTQAMRDLGATSLADLLRSEPAVSDAYNTLGYPENFAIRGMAIDPHLNFRFVGMPIHGHVPLALENAERVVVLKGVSGLLAGSSSPGGMVDVVLKRAGDQPLRSGLFALSERGSRYLASDLAERFGAQRESGVRANLAAEERRPMADNAPGDRRFASAFVDWRAPGGCRLEWHAQRHLYTQISVPGANLLDGRVLPPMLPRRNMNDQAWSAPFQSRENLSGLRWIQPLGELWVVRVSGLMQRVRTRDRIAFPDGCSSGPAPIYPGFCANGDADVYDFRSLDERRGSRSGEARLEGSLRTAGLSHKVSFGYRQARLEDRFYAAQAYNWVGTSNYFSAVLLSPDPKARTPNTNRKLSSREWSAQDRIRLRDRG